MQLRRYLRATRDGQGHGQSSGDAARGDRPGNGGDVDRRSPLNVLTLSPQGRALYDRVMPVALDHETELVDALTTAERDSLLNMLDKLQRRVATLRR